MVLVWAAIVVKLMVTDVWDESRALNLFQHHGPTKLISSNWMQDASRDVVIFRPVPMIAFTVIGAAFDDPEIVWRLLRSMNAVLVLASGGLLLGVIRLRRGVDLVRDVIFVAAFLFSGSAVITAGWFANGFDAMALFFVALATYLLARGNGWAAGASVGLAFFSKEVAVLAFPFILVLAWMEQLDRRETKRALLAAGIALVLFLVLRSVIVAPGSESDLRQLASGGTLSALLRLPLTFWWQGADVPVPLLGAATFIASLVLMRRWRAVVGLTALYAVTAALYGPIIKLGPSPLIHADNFAGRLYLVPAALALTLIALCGRRPALLVLLPPIIWGAGMTVARHDHFQKAYLAVYERASAVENPPLRVLCRFTKTTFENEFRRVAIGDFPDSRWLFKADGSLVHRKRRPNPPTPDSRAGSDESKP